MFPFFALAFCIRKIGCYQVLCKYAQANTCAYFCAAALTDAIPRRRQLPASQRSQLSAQPEAAVASGGWEVVHEYHDAEISGARSSGSPAWAGRDAQNSTTPNPTAGSSTNRGGDNSLKPSEIPLAALALLCLSTAIGHFPPDPWPLDLGELDRCETKIRKNSTIGSRTRTLRKCLYLESSTAAGAPCGLQVRGPSVLVWVWSELGELRMNWLYPLAPL